MIRRGVVAFFMMALLAGQAGAGSGTALMAASLKRHAPPTHVYEEQALVITDRQGRMTLRTLRAYSLSDEQGTRRVFIIDTPRDARGTRLALASGRYRREMNDLPGTSPIFGSNITRSDLEPEQVSDFDYVSERDQVLDRIQHHVLRATPANPLVMRRTGYHERQIFLRKDNLFISRIYYLDKDGHIVRRQTFRDPQVDETGGWHARMVLMEDIRDGEQTLIKVERRIHSPDHIPAILFAELRVEP